MHRNKQIAIILSDTLQSIGLQSMLTDYFPPVEISHYPTFEAFSTSGNDTFDYYFTNAALFVLYADFFLPRRSKTMVLIDETEGDTPITAIKGYVEGIQDGIANTPEKQRHYLEIVYNKSVILERLVRNMSDFSEYELGRMQDSYVLF